MKIYFAGSIRGGRNDAENYTSIINELKVYGNVLTEHIGDDALLKEEKQLSDKEIHDRDLDWLNQSDVIVAEVTQPSLGVGYELAVALHSDKKVLCLFNRSNGGRLSAMISGQTLYDIVEYSNVSEVKNILKHYFEHKNV